MANSVAKKQLPVESIGKKEKKRTVNEEHSGQRLMTAELEIWGKRRKRHSINVTGGEWRDRQRFGLAPRTSSEII